MKAILRREPAWEETAYEVQLLRRLHDAPVESCRFVFNRAQSLDGVTQRSCSMPPAELRAICLAYEFLDGDRRPQGLDEVREYMRQLFSALAALHARDVVHCDLKPANVRRPVDVASAVALRG